MGKFFIPLILWMAAVSDAAPFAFPMVAPLRIEKASYFPNGDRAGGSVSVIIRDAAGTKSFVHYKTEDAGKKQGGGLLTFREEKNEKGITFPNGNGGESDLLNHLRAACVETFGSADPGYLKEPGNWPGARDGFDRMAMASLLRHFPVDPQE